MSIPDAAIEAAELAVATHYDATPEHIARAAIEAAMPAIREAIAQEIEAESRTDFGQQWPIGLGHAIRIVRGGTA